MRNPRTTLALPVLRQHELSERQGEQMSDIDTGALRLLIPLGVMFLIAVLYLALRRAAERGTLPPMPDTTAELVEERARRHVREARRRRRALAVSDKRTRKRFGLAEPKHWGDE